MRNLFSKFIVMALLLLPTMALAQQSVSPMIVNGSGATPNCRVGNVASTSCPMPVTVSTVSASALYTQCSALCANLVVKASAGSLFDFDIAADSTLSGAAWWVMIYDAAAAPADGAVTPIKCYALPSGTTSFTGAFTQAMNASTGIVIGVSTNGCFTKAASTHAFIAAGYQ